MEVYGTKPKKFTKAWWEYFWMYYKWHTIALVFAAAIITTSAVQCANSPKYDLQADYIADTLFTDEQKANLEQLLCENINDASGNGKNEAFVLHLDMAESENVQVTQAMQTKFWLEQGFSDSYLFIGTEKYIRQLAATEIFEPAEKYFSGADGYYASLSGCEALENINIDTSDLCVAVRSVRDDDKNDEFQQKQYENALLIAEQLIGTR